MSGISTVAKEEVIAVLHAYLTVIGLQHLSKKYSLSIFASRTVDCEPAHHLTI